MARSIIRNLDDNRKSRLRVQAAQNNRSMKEEARNILCSALSPNKPVSNLADLALGLFGQEHGAELDDHPLVTPQEMEFE